MYSEQPCCVNSVEKGLCASAERKGTHGISGLKFESGENQDLWGEELQAQHQGAKQISSKIKTYSPALSQLSRLIRVFVFGTVSLCKAVLRYGPLCNKDLQSCVIV